MPKKLYEAADQTAVLQGVPNPGTDSVPGNVLKIVLVGLADWTLNATTIITSSAWSTFLNDDEKTHDVTPFIDNFDLPPTTPITEGGNDTSTWNGAPRTRSIGFATCKGKFSGLTTAQAKALRRLTAKTGNFQSGTRIGVIFLHEGKTISCRTGGLPFPIYNWYLSDAKKGGTPGASQDYEFEFHLEGGWSDEEVLLEAEFVTKTLTNPVIS